MRQLGQLEAAVMDRLWSSHQPVTVRNVLEDLRRDRSIAYTTVQTVMENLHRKGLLTRETSGSAYRYWSSRTREQHTVALMGQILDASTDRASTLLRFIEQMPAAEVAALRAALSGTVEPGPRP